MLGAYATCLCKGCFAPICRTRSTGTSSLQLPVAFTVTAWSAWRSNVACCGWLYGRPLETLLTTWGVSLLLIQTSRTVFGAQNVEVENLPGYRAASSSPAAWCCPITASLSVLCARGARGSVLVINRTRLGLFVRGVTQKPLDGELHRRTHPPRRHAHVWPGLGCGGPGRRRAVADRQRGSRSCQNYIVDSFMVVVLGGVGQLAGHQSLRSASARSPSSSSHFPARCWRRSSCWW